MAIDGWGCPHCLFNWYAYRTLLMYRSISCFIDTPGSADDLINRQHGQDVIDSLSVLEAVVPTLHQELWPKIRELFPMIAMALRSRFAIIRQSAARCFAAICDVMTVDAMRFVIETILPFLGDTLVNPNRQGATELVFSMSGYRPMIITYWCLASQMSSRGWIIRLYPTLFSSWFRFWDA